MQRRWNKRTWGEEREWPRENLKGYHMPDRTGLFSTAQVEGTVNNKHYLKAKFGLKTNV